MRWISWLAGGLAVISACCFIFAMISVSVDAMKRNVFSGSIAGIIEYNEVALVGMTFLGLAYAERVRAHVGVELLTRHLPAKVKHPVRLIGLLGVGVALVWLAIASTETAVESVKVQEFRYGLAQVPVWPARIAVPVGIAALLLALVVRMVGEVGAAWAAWRSRDG